MNKPGEKTKLWLDLIVIFWAAVAIVLFFLVLGSKQANAAPPPERSAHAISAKTAHARARGRYLARSCAALDYWHVICPERWPGK